LRDLIEFSFPKNRTPSLSFDRLGLNFPKNQSEGLYKFSSDCGFVGDNNNGVAFDGEPNPPNIPTGVCNPNPPVGDSIDKSGPFPKSGVGIEKGVNDMFGEMISDPVPTGICNGGGANCFFAACSVMGTDGVGLSRDLYLRRDGSAVNRLSPVSSVTIRFEIELFQRFLIAVSDRPGNFFAMSDHLQECCWTCWKMSSSSCGVHSVLMTLGSR
jgi:hypothetical protein